MKREYSDANLNSFNKNKLKNIIAEIKEKL
jgi:hypothetical protein